jgi:hypothetical protein
MDMIESSEGFEKFSVVRGIEFTIACICQNSPKSTIQDLSIFLFSKYTLINTNLDWSKPLLYSNIKMNSRVRNWIYPENY